MVEDLDDPSGFLRRYTEGSCGQLAIALAAHLGLPVKALFAAHIGPDGSRQVSADFVHAFVVVGDPVVLDARGFRTEDEIRAEFLPVLAGQRRNEDAETDYDERVFASASGFIEDAGIDVSGAVEALVQARKAFGFLGDITLTLLALEDMAERQHNAAPVLNAQRWAAPTRGDGLAIL